MAWKPFFVVRKACNFNCNWSGSVARGMTGKHMPSFDTFQQGRAPPSWLMVFCGTRRGQQITSFCFHFSCRDGWCKRHVSHSSGALRCKWLCLKNVEVFPWSMWAVADMGRRSMFVTQMLNAGSLMLLEVRIRQAKGRPVSKELLVKSLKIVASGKMSICVSILQAAPSQCWVQCGAPRSENHWRTELERKWNQKGSELF